MTANCTLKGKTWKRGGWALKLLSTHSCWSAETADSFPSANGNFTNVELVLLLYDMETGPWPTVNTREVFLHDYLFNSFLIE